MKKKKAKKTIAVIKVQIGPAMVSALNIISLWIDVPKSTFILDCPRLVTEPIVIKTLELAAQISCAQIILSDFLKYKANLEVEKYLIQVLLVM